MKRCLSLMITLLTVFWITPLSAGDDALPSWQEGDAEGAIVDYVQHVTAAGGDRRRGSQTYGAGGLYRQ